jgi:hypothetical protein
MTPGTLLVRFPAHSYDFSNHRYHPLHGSWRLAVGGGVIAHWESCTGKLHGHTRMLQGVIMPLPCPKPKTNRQPCDFPPERQSRTDYRAGQVLGHALAQV